MSVHLVAHFFGAVQVFGPGVVTMTAAQARSFAAQVLRAADDADDYDQEREQRAEAASESFRAWLGPEKA